MSTETELHLSSHHLNEKNDKQSTSSTRYQQLKARRIDLEKKLNEKYNLLQQICREEAQLTGIYPADFNCTSTNNNTTNELNNSATSLRRKVGTSFKLPENLLNNNEDDVNKLLLEKQIQQQISEASLRLANDHSQTKSIRRTHKQNYEAAQQKLLSIDQNLSLLKNRQQHQLNNAKKITQDDINLHKNARLLKSNLIAQSGNAQTLNCNNSLMYMERRNSMKSTTSSLGSSNTFVVQSPPSHPDQFISPRMMAHPSLRTRHDSFSNNSHFEYDSQHSPTPSHYSVQSQHQQQFYLQQQQQQQQMLRYQKSLKLKADQNYSPNHNLNAHHHHSHQQIYVSANDSPQQYVNRLQSLNAQYQQQMTGSPIQIHYAQDLLLTKANSPNSNSHNNYHSEIFHPPHVRHGNYSDDLKENNHQMLMQQQVRYHKTSNVEPLRGHQQIQQRPSQQQQGLGGYWVVNENNERVWCHTSDEKLSSLDRKSQMQKLKSTSSPNITAKVNSASNFDLSNKHDDFTPDSVSISSGNSNENKKREKIWRETSLDGPIGTPKTSKPSGHSKIKYSTSTVSLPPQHYGNQLDNINNNHLVYPTSPTSTKSFPNPNHNSYRSVSPTHSLQYPPMPPPHNNHMLLSARNSIYSTREDDSNIYDNVPPPPPHNLYYSSNCDQRNNFQNPNLPPKAKLKHTDSTRSIPNATGLLQVDVSDRYQMQHGDFENNNVRQISPTPTIMSTSTYISTQSPSLNMLRSPEIQTESPKNVTVIQPGKIQPYKEVTKPFEMSDFYKYSTKFRQQTQSAVLQSEQPQKNSYYQQSPTVYNK